MRYSKQRELIFDFLKQNPVHPTADYIYSLLKKEKPSLSLGTVYRNLNLLAREGLILKFGGFDGSEHFDHHTHIHSHFVCEVCGTILDIEMPKIIKTFISKIKTENGLNVNTSNFVLTGTCSKCK